MGPFVTPSIFHRNLFSESIIHIILFLYTVHFISEMIIDFIIHNLNIFYLKSCFITGFYFITYLLWSRNIYL